MKKSDWSLVTADAHEACGARRAIRNFLAVDADGAASDLDDVESIVGELVANAIRYAPGPIGLHVFWQGNSATLIFSDRGPGLPAVRPVPDSEATSGRGLFLIQALAREVEIDAVAGHGTRFVVQLPVHRAVAAL